MSDKQPEYARKVPPPGEIEKRGVVTDVLVPLAGPAVTLYGIHKLNKPKDPKDK